MMEELLTHPPSRDKGSILWSAGIRVVFYGVLAFLGTRAVFYGVLVFCGIIIMVYLG